LENSSPPELVKIIETYKAQYVLPIADCLSGDDAAMDRALIVVAAACIVAGEDLAGAGFDSWTRRRKTDPTASAAPK